MKNKILILTIFFILSTMNFSFAFSTDNPVVNNLLTVEAPSRGIRDPYVVGFVDTDGSEKYFLTSYEMTVPNYPPLALRIDAVGKLTYSYDADGTYIRAHNSSTIYHINDVFLSTYDILYDNGSVFFSPPTVPLLEMAVEGFLPNLVNQVGGIISLGLVMFGLLLAVTLIPRLILR